VVTGALLQISVSRLLHLPLVASSDGPCTAAFVVAACTFLCLASNALRKGGDEIT
jgi:hypothetical protein